MRAKFIDEYYFERGLDPKNAMNIGNNYYRLLRKMQPKTLYKSDEVKWGYANFFKYKNKIYYFYTKPSKNRIDKPHEIQEDAGFILPDLKIRRKMTDKGWNTLISDFTFNETQNFTRGLDPKDAMNIGKKAMDQKIIDETDWSIDYSTIISIYDIVEVIHNYRGFPILILKEKGKEDTSWPYRGISRKARPLAEVKKIIGEFCFSHEQALREIKNKIDKWVDNGYLHESHNFTRGLDPKDAMKIGMQNQFIKWMNELRLGKEVGAISLMHLTTISPWWLDVSYYGESNEFTKILNNIFPKDVFTKITIERRNPKSFQKGVKLLVNPKYEKFLRNSFTSDGFIKESQNFTRGLDPKDALDIGDKEERKKVLIQKIIKFDPKILQDDFFKDTTYPFRYVMDQKKEWDVYPMHLDKYEYLLKFYNMLLNFTNHIKLT
jgi:hypothetical protein